MTTSKILTRGEKAYREDLFDNIVHHLESLHKQGWITTHSFDVMVQGVLYDKSDPEGAKQGRDPASIAAAPVDSTKLGGGGQGHGVNVFGRKISIGNSTTYLVAIEDFTAQQPGDLDFRRGDTIEHLSDVDENWARGRVNGQEGIFPKSFAVMPNK